MSENRHFPKIIIILIAAAVTVCFLAMAFSGKLTEMFGGKNVRMEYETKLFDTSQVMSVDIRMDEETWNEMLANAAAEEYYPCDVVINGKEIDDVAIRPKGNTSLMAIASDPDSDRFSLKLEFDHYAKGQTCYGLDKLILNNNYADATNMKEAIVYDMYQFIGAEASLYNYAEVSVNGEYWGVYLALEGVEKSFMLRNFGTQDGELYKPDSMEMGGGASDSSGSSSGGGMVPGGFSFDPSNMPGSGESSFPGSGENGSGGFSFDPSNMPGNGGGTFPGNGEDGSGGFSFDPSNMPGNGEGGFPGSGENGSGGFSFDPSNIPGNGEGTFPGSGEGTFPETGESSPSESGAAPEGGSSESESRPDMSGFRPSGGGGFSMGGGGGFSTGGGGANLNYTDDDLESYSTIWEGSVTATGSEDHRRVVKALKNISEGTDLEQYLDVDNILKYMAVHVFSVNMDSLSGSMAHNYYLYEYKGQLNLFPWDYNLSFGGMSAGGGGDASGVINDAIDTPFAGTRFFDALLSNEEYRARYHEYLRQLVDEYVNGGRFEETYNRIRSQIDGLVETDPTAFYTYEEYQNAAQILYDTVKLRAESIKGQLDGTIPSTDTGQREDSSSLIDASSIDIEAMGQFDMGGGSSSFGPGSFSQAAGTPSGTEADGTGQTGPPADTGESQPPADTGESLPPADSSGSQPPSDIDGDTPSSGSSGNRPASPPEGGQMPASMPGMPGQSSAKTDNLITYAVCLAIAAAALIAVWLCRRRTPGRRKKTNRRE